MFVNSHKNQRLTRILQSLAFYFTQHGYHKYYQKMVFFIFSSYKSTGNYSAFFSEKKKVKRLGRIHLPKGSQILDLTKLESIFNMHIK